MDKINKIIDGLKQIDENIIELTVDQYAKLETIHDVIVNILDKINCNIRTPQLVNIVKDINILEKIDYVEIKKFAEFQSINEVVTKQRNSWLVKSKGGNTVLGTHSSKKKAIQQLQAIEISKTTNAKK